MNSKRCTHLAVGLGIGFGFGCLFTVILLNAVAHDTIKKNPTILLSEYWDGK